jgi:hypothetical protein
MQRKLSEEARAVDMESPNLVEIIVGALGLGGIIKAFHSDWKADREKTAADVRMREIAVSVMNPELQEERHNTVNEKLDKLTNLVEAQMPGIVRDSTLAGMQAGYRIVIKKREDP